MKNAIDVIHVLCSRALKWTIKQILRNRDERFQQKEKYRLEQIYETDVPYT